MRYRVLIIDDEYAQKDREDVYRKLIEEDSENEFVSVATDNLEVIKKEVPRSHIALVDIFLEEDGDPFVLGGLDVIDLIQQTSNIPIYLVTSKWTQVEFRKYKDYILRDKIVGGATFDQLKKRNERWRIRIDFKKAIFRHSNKILLNLGANDSLNILHLSDTQFGGEWENTLGTGENPYERVIDDIIASVPIKEDGIPFDTHLLLITGDISQTGSPIEYHIAYKQIKKMCKRLIIDEESIFIVPGNHDITMPLCAANKINVDLQKKRNKIRLNGNDGTLTNYSLAPFSDFSRNLTGRDDWSYDCSKKAEKKQREYFFTNSLRNYGINIIGINSAINLNIEAHKSPSIEENLIDELNHKIKDAHESDKESLNIYLLHHKPWPDTDDSLKEDGELLLLKLSQYNDALFLCGHRHEGCSNLQTFSPKSDDFFLYAIAPTPSLVDRKPNTLRGFNYIMLNRKKDLVNDITILQFHHQGGVKFELNTKKTYQRGDKQWVLDQ